MSRKGSRFLRDQKNGRVNIGPVSTIMTTPQITTANQGFKAMSSPSERPRRIVQNSNPRNINHAKGRQPLLCWESTFSTNQQDFVRSSILLESNVLWRDTLGGIVRSVLAVSWNDTLLVWQVQQAGSSRGRADIQGRQVAVEMEMLYLWNRLRNRGLSEI